jgi:hypothetical protein
MLVEHRRDISQRFILRAGTMIVNCDVDAVLGCDPVQKRERLTLGAPIDVLETHSLRELQDGPRDSFIRSECVVDVDADCPDSSRFEGTLRSADLRVRRISREMAVVQFEIAKPQLVRVFQHCVESNVVKAPRLDADSISSVFLRQHGERCSGKRGDKRSTGHFSRKRETRDQN